MIPVRLSAAAERDLDSIEKWLTQEGAGSHAFAQHKRLFLALASLGEDWAMWPPIDTRRIPKARGVRKRILGEYLIGYVVEGKGDKMNVFVLRIFGPGQFRG